MKNINVSFRQYIGLAGDPDVLLIAEASNGLMETCLWDRCLPFKEFRLKRAKKKLIGLLEFNNRIKYVEA